METEQMRHMQRYTVPAATKTTTKETCTKNEKKKLKQSAAQTTLPERERETEGCGVYEGAPMIEAGTSAGDRRSAAVKRKSMTYDINSNNNKNNSKREKTHVEREEMQRERSEGKRE